MSASRQGIGYASIVLERQAYGLLVTVTLCSDLANPQDDRIVRFTSVDAAIDAAVRFLVAWASSNG